ncbi:hypothetical protein ACHWQZ_G003712 [Mnemiopsis leidyi]
MNVFVRFAALLVTVIYYTASSGTDTHLDLENSPEDNLENLPVEDLENSHEKDLENLPVEDLENSHEKDLENLPVEDLENSHKKDLENLPVEDLENSHEKDLEDLPAADLYYLPPADLDNLPPADLENMSPKTLETEDGVSFKQDISSAFPPSSPLQTLDILFVPFATGGGSGGKFFIGEGKAEGSNTEFVPFVTAANLTFNFTETEVPKKSLPRSFIGLISFNIILSVFCIALNIILVHYRRKAGSGRSMVNVLYLRNGLADIFVGVGVLLQGPILCFLLWKKEDLSGLTVPAYISYCITAIAIKMSVFMNCVLGVVRCINIVRPFYHVSHRALSIWSLVYMALWVANVALDLWQFTIKLGTKNTMLVVRALVMKGQPGFGLVLLTTEKGDYEASYFAYHLGNLIQFILPIALPTLLCFALMIVQICHLSKQQLTINALVPQVNTGSAEGKGPKSPNSGNRKASITICIVTIIYVCSSAVAVTTWLIIDGRKGYFGSKEQYESLMEEKRTAVPWSDLAAIYFALSTCPLICSTLTPLTLLLRGTGAAFSSVRRLVSRFSTASMLLP